MNIKSDEYKDVTYMTFGIVGPISKDHITLATGEKLEKYGAVAYSASALAKLLEGTQERIICLSHLAKADVEEVSQILSHPNIDLVGLIALENETAEIKLTYINEYERRSLQIRSMEPLTLAEMSLLSECCSAQPKRH